MADLTDLGLSEYESSAYRALLDVGTATAQELSDASGVPMGRIYDVLGGLESRHLVRSQAASKPKKYVAVEPESALDHLLEERRRELRAEAEQYEEAVDSLVRELEGPPKPEAGFWTAEVGADDTFALLLERIGAAQDSVSVVSGASSNFDVRTASDDVADAISSVLDRDAEVRILLSPAAVETIPVDFDETRLDFPTRDGFEARVGDAVYGDVIVIDGVEVCVGFPNPLEPDEAFALIDLTDPSFAARVAAEFERGWADADRLEPR
ncbi:MAG: TrmB family transcriptional regulator [Halarchaeum sp.]